MTFEVGAFGCAQRIKGQTTELPRKSVTIEKRRFGGVLQFSDEVFSKTVYFSIVSLPPTIRPNTTQESCPLPPGRQCP